jgi:hypothetical protein
MEREIPIDLRSDVKDTVIPIFTALREAGWYVGIIHWESQEKRIVGFSAQARFGSRIRVTCGEDDLAARLQSLLDSK